MSDLIQKAIKFAEEKHKGFRLNENPHSLGKRLSYIINDFYYNFLQIFKSVINIKIRSNFYKKYKYLHIFDSIR